MNSKTYEIVSIVRQIEEIEAKFDEIFEYHKKFDQTTELLQADIHSLRADRNRLENNLRELENK